MTRTAIIAAMPGELKSFLDSQSKEDWVHERRGKVRLWRLVWPEDQSEWIAACAGAGQAAATCAFAEIEKSGPIDIAISTGWAGALREDYCTGQAYCVSTVVDTLTGERFPTSDGAPNCLLVTSPQVADMQEKERLASAYSAALVDMEAAAIARLAQMRQIPFYCIKGISDGVNDQLPDFNSFILPNGAFQLSRFVLFSILRPWYWPALIQMGENSRKAAQSIAECLLHLLNPRGQYK